jgi:hypothetical protein
MVSRDRSLSVCGDKEMKKWFHVISVGYVFCSATELRLALPHWKIEETTHSGIAYKK